MSKFQPVKFEVLQFEDHLGNKYSDEEWNEYLNDLLLDKVDLSQFGLSNGC